VPRDPLWIAPWWQDWFATALRDVMAGQRFDSQDHHGAIEARLASVTDAGPGVRARAADRGRPAV